MIEHYLNFLNNSKVFAGCIMLLMNLGGRYIVNELPEGIDEVLNNVWVRRIVIFSIAFIATRDVKVSLLLTLVFVLLCQFLLDRRSRFYMLDKANRKVSREDALRAYNVLREYKKQEKGSAVNRV